MSDEMAFAVERSFLAQEFLTWLWFRCEAEGGEFPLGDTTVAMVVEDALALTSWDEDGTRVTLRGGTPTLCPGAAGALGSGLMLRRARFVLAQSDREWQFTLDGETLDLSGVKVPTPAEEDDDVEDVLAEKLSLGEELRGIIDALYLQFLALRLGDDWQGIEVPRLYDWVRVKVDKAWAALGAA